MTDPSPDADDETVLQWYQDIAARTELRILRLQWVTADPLPHIDSPYVCFRVSAAVSKALPANAVARLLDDEEEIVRLTMARTAPHLVDPATAENIERRYRRRDKFTFWWDKEDRLQQYGTALDHPQLGCHRHTFLAPDRSRQHLENPSTTVKTDENSGDGYGPVAAAILEKEHVPAPDGRTKTFTDPRLCAAIVDRLTFGGNTSRPAPTPSASPEPEPAMSAAARADDPSVARIIGQGVTRRGSSLSLPCRPARCADVARPPSRIPPRHRRTARARHRLRPSG